ncbi:hypothetical protein C7N43_02855 [Sphingobacteriales bacterium UPWRP_1]|nr:hypothetical protein BVG80_09360 [Sphingobacteriales bacterium TSM_CSM]PSJ78560.1 hypothetical protein C7N43_02855 [Sphingobacteriales bacterium UPWRP_1]
MLRNRPFWLANHCRFLGWLASLLIYCINTPLLWAQDSTKQAHPDTLLYGSGAVVWRGFTHQWSYNHRLNRLGSYIENPPEFSGFPFTATFYHTSATGIGPDAGMYNGFYSYVAANGVTIQPAQKTIRFSGKLGDMHAATFEVLADAPKNFTDNYQHTVIINGFDIVSERRADKLQMFRISVSDGYYLPATQQIRFTVEAAFLVHCQSVECNYLSSRFDYNINLQFLIFSATEEYMFSAQQGYHYVYNWGKHDEVQHDFYDEYKISGIGNDLYPVAMLAFKSINITLDRPHWYVAWHSVIQPQKYDSKLGNYLFALDLLFKQWSSDMRKRSAYPPKSKFSLKRNGWAAIDGTVVMLQFSSGFVLNSSSKGAFKWAGKNMPANMQTSVTRQDIVFDSGVFLKDIQQFRQSSLQQEEQVRQLYQQYINDLTKLKEQRKQEKEQEKEHRKQEKKHEPK